jgi:redox-sensitive bicupin YhaK (pirin superfamily)
MIRIRRSAERGRANHGWLDARHSFSFAGYFDPDHVGFRKLRVLNEDRIQPGAGFPEHGHEDMEIITYVIDGGLTHRDSTGSVATLEPGDVQVMSAGRGIRHSEFNASHERELHLIQVWIEPAERGAEPRHAEAHFADSTRRGQLRAIAASDGRDGSLPIGQDAVVYASVLDSGQVIEHELDPGRYAWLQLVRGALSVNGEPLAAGDGAAIDGETRLELRALEEAEILLFDLA